MGNGQNCAGKELICFMTPYLTSCSKIAADLGQVSGQIIKKLISTSLLP